MPTFIHLQMWSGLYCIYLHRNTTPKTSVETMSSHDFESVQRAVLAEVTKHDHGLKHVDPPAECLSTTQAKMLLEVQGGKHELNHVEHRPKDGLTDAEKQAYLQEKQTK